MPESVWTQFNCHYNLFFPGPGANQKWFKQKFHRYTVCHALERHGGVILEKAEQIFCKKENFDREWKMTVYKWVKLLYYST